MQKKRLNYRSLSEEMCQTSMNLTNMGTYEGPQQGSSYRTTIVEEIKKQRRLGMPLCGIRIA